MYTSILYISFGLASPFPLPTIPMQIQVPFSVNSKEQCDRGKEELMRMNAESVIPGGRIVNAQCVPSPQPRGR